MKRKRNRKLLSGLILVSLTPILTFATDGSSSFAYYSGNAASGSSYANPLGDVINSQNNSHFLPQYITSTLNGITFYNVGNNQTSDPGPISGFSRIYGGLGNVFLNPMMLPVNPSIDTTNYFLTAPLLPLTINPTDTTWYAPLTSATDASSLNNKAPMVFNGVTVTGAGSNSYLGPGTVYGYASRVYGLGATAVGNNVTTAGNGTVAIGNYASILWSNMDVLGNANNNYEGKLIPRDDDLWKETIGSIAIGDFAKVTSEPDIFSVLQSPNYGGQGIAIGTLTRATAKSIAIGPSALALQPNSIAIGSANSNTNTTPLGDYKKGLLKPALDYMATKVPTYTKNLRNTNVLNYNTELINEGLLNQSLANGESAVAIGPRAVALGNKGIALGSASFVTKDEGMALGTNAFSDDKDAMAVGANALASKDHAVSVGNNAQALNTGSMSSGNYAIAGGAHAVAIGNYVYANVAMNTDSMSSSTTGGTDLATQAALASANGAGYVNTVTDAIDGANGTQYKQQNYHDVMNAAVPNNNDNAIVIGYNSAAIASDALAVGHGATAAGDHSMALGFNAAGNQVGAVAVGPSSRAYAENAIAIGNGAGVDTLGSQSIAIGAGSVNGAEGATLLGQGSRLYSNAGRTTAIGYSNNVSAGNSVALGNYAVAASDNETPGSATNNVVAIGNQTLVGKGTTNSIVLGPQAGIYNNPNKVSLALNGTDASSIQAYETNAQAVAGQATGVNNAIVMGYQALATGGSTSQPLQDVIAMGSHAQATLSNSVALGSNAITDYKVSDLEKAPWTPDGTLMTITPTSSAGIISIGSEGHERRISNVAAGYRDTDAVNVAQLKLVAARAVEGLLHSQGFSGTPYVSTAVAGDAQTVANYATMTKDYARYVKLQAYYLGIQAKEKFGQQFDADEVNAFKKEIDTLTGKYQNFTTTATKLGSIDVNKFSSLSAALQAIAGAEKADAALNVTGKTPEDLEALYKATNYNNQGAAGENSIAIGYKAQTDAAAADGVAIGEQSLAKGTSSVAMGMQAQATGVNALALGAQANASGKNSVALGASSVATDDNVISVGTTGSERRIIHVASGTGEKDAVNVGQLKGVSVTLAGNTDKTTAKAVTMNAQGAVTGIALGVKGYDSGNAIAGVSLPVSTPATQDITSVAKGDTVWLFLNKGNVTATDARVVSGKDVYDAIENAKPVVTTSGSYLSVVGTKSKDINGNTFTLSFNDTPLANKFAEKNGSNIDVSDWQTKLSITSPQALEQKLTANQTIVAVTGNELTVSKSGTGPITYTLGLNPTITNKLSNLPDNTNTALGDKLDASTFNTYKTDVGKSITDINNELKTYANQDLNNISNVGEEKIKTLASGLVTVSAADETVTVTPSKTGDVENYAVKVNTSKLDAGAIKNLLGGVTNSIDGTSTPSLTGPSATGNELPTSNAVKNYVDQKMSALTGAGAGYTLQGNSGSALTKLGNKIVIQGATGGDVTANVVSDGHDGATVTLQLEDAFKNKVNNALQTDGSNITSDVKEGLLKKLGLDTLGTTYANVNGSNITNPETWRSKLDVPTTEVMKDAIQKGSSTVTIATASQPYLSVDSTVLNSDKGPTQYAIGLNSDVISKLSHLPADTTAALGQKVDTTTYSRDMNSVNSKTASLDTQIKTLADRSLSNLTPAGTKVIQQAAADAVDVTSSSQGLKVASALNADKTIKTFTLSLDESKFDANKIKALIGGITETIPSAQTPLTQEQSGNLPTTGAVTSYVKTQLKTATDSFDTALKNTINKGFNVAADAGNATTVPLGKTLAIQGDNDLISTVVSDGNNGGATVKLQLSKTILDKINAGSTGVTNLSKEAITFITNTAKAQATGANKIASPLGSSLQVLGAADGTYDADAYGFGNVVTTVTGANSVGIAFKKNPLFTSVTVGTVANNGVNLSGAMGALTLKDASANAGESSAVLVKNVKSGMNLTGTYGSAFVAAAPVAPSAITAVAAKGAVSGLLTTTGDTLLNAANIADVQALAQAGIWVAGNQGQATSTATTVHAPLSSTLSLLGNTGQVNASQFSSDNVLTTTEEDSSGNPVVHILMNTMPTFQGVTLQGTPQGTSPAITLTPSDGTLHLSKGAGGDVSITGVASGNSRDSVATKGDLDDLSASLGLAHATDNTSNPTLGPASEDGLNNASILNKVGALRDGTAGTVVYTTKAGDRVALVNNQWYKTEDVAGKSFIQGKWYANDQVTESGTLKEGAQPIAVQPESIATKDIVLSGVNASGVTTAPTVLQNVASVVAPTSATALTSEQGKMAVGTLTTLKGAALQQVATAGDLQAVAQAGLTFTSNLNGGTNSVTEPIGSTFSIEGAKGVTYDGTYDTANVATTLDGSTVRVGFKKAPSFTGVGLENAGNDTIYLTNAGTDTLKLEGGVNKGPVTITNVKTGSDDSSVVTNKGMHDAVQTAIDNALTPIRKDMTAQQAGVQGPVVYTDGAGTRLGADAIKTANSLGLSLVNPQAVPGKDTTTPIQLKNVASGLGVTSPLTANIAQEKVASLTNTQSSTLPLYVAANIQDLQALAMTGWTVTSNDVNAGAGITNTQRTMLGASLGIQGAASNTYDGSTFSANNLVTYVDNGILRIAMATDPMLKGLTLQKGTTNITVTPTDTGLKFAKDSQPIVITGVAPGTSDDAIATEGEVNNIRKVLGLVPASESTGAAGPAGQDNLNGASVVTQALALRDGTAGSMVYTTSDGERIARVGTALYKASEIAGKVQVDGKWYEAKDVVGGKVTDGAQPVSVTALPANTPIMTSAVTVMGSTTSPQVLGNIASGLGLTGNADNTSVLTPLAPKDLESINATTATTVTQGLLTKKGAVLAHATTVGDLQALAQAGLTLTSNATTATDTEATWHLPLGTTVSVQGDTNNTYDGTSYSTGNLVTYIDTSGTNPVLRMAMKTTPQFAGLQLGTGTSPITITPDTTNSSLSISQPGAKDGVVITGIKDGTGENSVATKGSIDKLRNELGLNTTSETAPTTGPLAKDDIGKDTLSGKVKALREGLAGTVVYTDAQGNRLTTLDNAPQNTQLSAVNVDGSTTTPIAIGNVASVVAPTSTTALTSEQGKTAVDALTKLSGAGLQRVATAGDLQAVAQAGLTFKGNEGADIVAPISSTVSIMGDAANTSATGFSSANVMTTTNAQTKAVQILLKDTPQFTGVGLGTAGLGVTVTASNGEVTFSSQHSGPVVGTTGASNNGVVLRGLASSTAADAAVTVGQMDAKLQQVSGALQPLTITSNLNGGTHSFKTQLGSTWGIEGASGVTYNNTYSTDNLATTIDTTGATPILRIGMKTQPVFDAVQFSAPGSSNVVATLGMVNDVLSLTKGGKSVPVATLDDGFYVSTDHGSYYLPLNGTLKLTNLGDTNIEVSAPSNIHRNAATGDVVNASSSASESPASTNGSISASTTSAVVTNPSGPIPAPSNSVAIQSSSTPTYTSVTVKQAITDTTAENTLVPKKYVDDKEGITLSDAKKYTDQEIASLKQSITANENSASKNDINVLRSQMNEQWQDANRRSAAGTASAMASAAIPQPLVATKYGNIGVGAGSYGGEQAFALGLVGMNHQGTITYKLTGTVDSLGHHGISAGATFAIGRSGSIPYTGNPQALLQEMEALKADNARMKAENKKMATKTETMQQEIDALMKMVQELKQKK